MVWEAALVVSRAMSKDYDAAVMSGGFSDSCRGFPPTRWLYLEVLSAKYNLASRTFLRGSDRWRVADRLHQRCGNYSYGQLVPVDDELN